MWLSNVQVVRSADEATLCKNQLLNVCAAGELLNTQKELTFCDFIFCCLQSDV